MQTFSLGRFTRISFVLLPTPSLPHDYHSSSSTHLPLCCCCVVLMEWKRWNSQIFIFISQFVKSFSLFINHIYLMLGKLFNPSLLCSAPLRSVRYTRGYFPLNHKFNIRCTNQNYDLFEWISSLYPYLLLYSLIHAISH